MLDSLSRLEILKHLDIPVWEKRNHGLFLDKPLIAAKLAILLSKPLKRDEAEERKVLLGMLNVLELEKNGYWMGWLKENKAFSDYQVEVETEIKTETETKNRDLQVAISQMIARFAPQKILFLGESWPELLTGMTLDSRITLYYTFHPEELIKMPEKKKKAYQILLNLKQSL